MSEPEGGSLPAGWTRVTVESLAPDEPGALTDGPFGSNLKSSHYTDRGPRVIRLQNIGEGVFLDERAHISEEHFAQLRKHEARANDVVIAMLGEKLPRSCVVPEDLGPAIVKADCVRLRVDARIALAQYVSHGLNSDKVRREAAKLVHGVGRPRLGLTLLRNIGFPLAPLVEQKRIVDAIDTYFTCLDDAVATLERVQRNLKRYRASVLKAAVEGRLVPTEAELARAEKRDYEPASELLKRILAERRRRWSGKGKYEEPAALDMSNLPALPQGWCWARADALYWDAGYGTSQKCSYDAKGPPVLRIPNVQDQFLRLDDLKYAIDPGALSQEGAVEPADFLFIRTNGSKSLIGRGALVRAPLPLPHHFASYLIRLRLIDIDGLPDWFTLAWHCPIVRDQLMVDAASSAGQHNVSLGAARSYVIPLPPALEQRRIVSEVERLTSVAMASQAQAETTLSRCTRLRQSILKWAFEGKLVDQDPNDEPASALLDRIRAQKTARTK